MSPGLQTGAEFREQYAGLIEKFRLDRPRWIKDARTLHLPACVPPWTETGIALQRGERLTLLAAGRVMWSRKSDLFAGPRYHLWAGSVMGRFFGWVAIRAR